MVLFPNGIQNKENPIFIYHGRIIEKQQRKRINFTSKDQQ
jgi:hypothetical protein